MRMDMAGDGGGGRRCRGAWQTGLGRQTGGRVWEGREVGDKKKKSCDLLSSRRHVPRHKELGKAQGRVRGVRWGVSGFRNRNRNSNGDREHVCSGCEGG